MNKRQNNQFRHILSLVRFKSYITDNFKRLRKRIFVFLVFVILASFFWFYRALDDTYVEDIKYPVKFINLPSNKILTSTPPEKISLRVRGDGYSILSKKFKAPYLTFDVNNFSLHSQSLDSLSVYLITQKARESLTNQLISENEQLEIINISPDTIFFNFSKTRTKKVSVIPVFSNPENLYAPQHTLNGKMQIEPDSVILVGPANILDSVFFLKTKPISLFELKDTTRTKSKLVSIAGTQVSSEKINITIPVDRFTESNFNLPLQVKHTPDSLILKVFPRSVKINYKVTLSRYKLISETDFRPYVDYNDILSEASVSNPKLKVYLDSIPEYTFSISIYPSIVEFLIESDNAEDRNNRGNR